MGKRKYDWDKLEVEYISGDWLDQHSFADHVGVDYSYLRNISCKRKWEEKKRQYLAQRAEEIQKKTLEKQVKIEADRNAAHLRTWDNFLKNVIEVLEDCKIRMGDGQLTIFTLERLANVMDKLQRGQRLALGLDKEHTSDVNSLAELVRAIKESAAPLTALPEETTAEPEKTAPENPNGEPPGG
jgi:D-mannonate dehydratase